MKHRLLSGIVILVITCFYSFGQQYSKCKVYADAQGLQKISNLGVAVDHGTLKANTFFIGDFSEEEITLMKKNNFVVEVLIEDLVSYYQNRSSENEILRNATCQESGGFDPKTPTHFKLGSMAGYYTYAEFLAELDEMQQQYPELISVKSPIGNFLTHENRPIYWVRISDFASLDEEEPEVLYTALHHAREPACLSSTIFYMWYLLENYATDPEIKYLIDETEMYFIPMLNPDGYIENQTSQPNGGGMWRKNKRNNGDGTFGVDLNRNYSYEWGTSGVEFNTSSNVYPGTAAFSEPETQAVKWFCENRNFLFAHNAHTYGNLILFPIGSSIAEFATDHEYLLSVGSQMARFNNYIVQKASSLYPASGGSDDYMYLMDLSLKPKIYSYTPEIGSSTDGFWPPQANIIPICKNMVFSNLMLAHLVHNYWEVKDIDPNSITAEAGDFHFDVKRLGLENQALTVSVEPITGIQTVGSPVVFNSGFNVALNTYLSGTIAYTLDANIQQGDEIKYVLITDLGSFVKRDTLVKVYGNPTLQLSDDASNTSNWSGNWNITSSTYFSPNFSFTDSPDNMYLNNSKKIYNLISNVDLTNATQVKIEFYAKWSIEATYDYARMEISTDGGTSWIGQCGKYTKPGVGGNGGVQPVGEPIYDGTQSDWVLEEIDLSSYLGEIIQIRFILASDGGVTDDGFYFDDFKILYDVNNIGLDEKEQPPIKIFPNPAKNRLTLSHSEAFEQTEIKIYSLNGKLIKKFNINSNQHTIELDISEIDNGLYYIDCIGRNRMRKAKFSILK